MSKLKKRFPTQFNHIAINTKRTKLEITFGVKMTSILNHTLRKLKRSLALTKNANPNLPQRSYQGWNQDLQKPQKEP